VVKGKPVCPNGTHAVRLIKVKGFTSVDDSVGDLFTAVDRSVVIKFSDPMAVLKACFKAKGDDFAADNLHKFKGLHNRESALALIADGYGIFVLHHLRRFGLDSTEAALAFIAAGEGRFVAMNLNKPILADLNHSEVALALIAAGEGKYVAGHMRSFKELNHIETVRQLITAGDGEWVAKKLDGIDANHIETARQLITAGDGEWVAKKLDGFKDANHVDIARRLLEAGDGEFVAAYLRKFNGLNPEIARALIAAGYGKSVAENLDKFVDLDHNEIARQLDVEWVANNLERFKGLDHAAAKSLIKAGKGRVITSYLDSFMISSHDEIAQALIEAGYSDYVAGKLDQFKDLGPEVARELIEAGYSDYVTSSIRSFGRFSRREVKRMVGGQSA
jgi:hypothetical protein